MLARLNPLTGDDIMDNVFDRMERIWNSPGWKMTNPKSDYTWSSIWETKNSPVQRYVQDDKLHLEFEVPGFSKEDLKIEYGDGRVYVSGQKGSRSISFQESMSSTFISDNNTGGISSAPETWEYRKILKDTISATCENGILTVTAELEKPEKRERRNVREIAIT